MIPPIHSDTLGINAKCASNFWGSSLVQVCSLFFLIIKKKVSSHFSFLDDLKQFPDTYPLLSDLITIESRNYSKEKRERDALSITFLHLL